MLASAPERTPVIPADIAKVLPALIAEADAAMAPLGDEELMHECTAVTALIGVGDSQSEKTEWIATAILQLSRFPAGLVREALADAPLKCVRLKEVLKFVVEYCEDYPNRMKTRRDRLVQLDKMAKEQHPHV